MSSECNLDVYCGREDVTEAHGAIMHQRSLCKDVYENNYGADIKYMQTCKWRT